MISWDTTSRLLKQRPTNPLLIGLVIQELEEQIEILQEKRETEDLTVTDEELLRGFTIKRYLLIKKMRDYFRIQDYCDDRNIERVVQEYCGSNGEIDFCCHRAARRARKKDGGD
jgi:hypothetical protein